MLVGKRYKVESDSQNVTLYERGTAKEGDTYWRPIAYFSTVKQALEGLVNLEVNEAGLKDLETVAKRQDEVIGMVKALKLP